MALRLQTAKNKCAPVLPTPDQNLSDARPPTILVVEDDAAVRKILEIAILTFDFLVKTAASSKEAQDIVRCEKIDVVVMDIQMPVTDGPETWLMLRAFDPALRCCFISGYEGDYTFEDLMSLGADGFLQKPFHLEELRKLVVDSVRKHHSLKE